MGTIPFNKALDYFILAEANHRVGFTGAGLPVGE